MTGLERAARYGMFGSSLAGSAAPAKVQLDVGPQIYFEEGELLVPPTFDQTDEEKKG